MPTTAVRTIGSLVVLASLGTSVYANQQEPHSVRDFAVRLAANAIPAGVVAPEDHLAAKGSPPQRDPKGKAAFSANLPELVAEFNRSRPTMRARSKDGVIRLEAIRLTEQVKELLSREIAISDTQQFSAGDAIFRVLIGLVRGAEVTGLAGVGVLPGPSCRLQDRVDIPPGIYTVSSYLDMVTTQLPGLVWLVTYTSHQPNDALKIGVICPGGETLRMRIHQ